MSRTSGLSTVCLGLLPSQALSLTQATDIRTWHANIEQHASEGVNKILIGNKSDWTDKRVVAEEQGRRLADELGIKFMETSAKQNQGVEEAFFTLARSALRATSTCIIADNHRTCITETSRYA
jgi:GTPase SAR1 family protein